MPNFLNFAMSMLRNNPRIANNPQSQQIVNAIQNKDMDAAQQLAQQICQQQGISIDQAREMTTQSMQQFPNFN